MACISVYNCFTNPIHWGIHGSSTFIIWKSHHREQGKGLWNNWNWFCSNCSDNLKGPYGTYNKLQIKAYGLGSRIRDYFWYAELALWDELKCQSVRSSENKKMPQSAFWPPNLIFLSLLMPYKMHLKGFLKIKFIFKA